MTALAAILVLLCGLLSWALFLSLRRNMKLMDRMEDLAEQVEISLDALDEHYQKIDRASKTDLFSDEPIVKELVRDMAAAKEAVRSVAARLYKSMEDDDNDEEDAGEE